MAKRPPTPRGSGSRWLFYGLALAAFLVFLSLAPTLYHRLTCPFQVQQEEAVNLEFGKVLLAGEPLYRDIRQEGPYLHPYTALYPVFLSWCMRLVPGLWLPGRLPAFLAFLACGLLLGAWGWKRWGKPAALALVGVFLLSPTWLSWGTMARMDSLLVLLNFAAFLSLYRVIPQNPKASLKAGQKAWVTAGLLNSLALMMKASACTFTLAALGAALWNRQWKKGALFLSAVVLPYVLFTAYWQWKSQGAYSLFLQWQASDLHLSVLWYFLTTSFARECLWLALALLPFLALRPLPLALKLQVLFSGLWFLAAACMSTAAENHYMEFLLFGLFALGEGLASKGRLGAELEGWALAWMALGLVLYSTAAPPRLPSLEEMQAKSLMLAQYEKPGDYFAVDADLPYMAGRRIWYQYSGLEPYYRGGFWNPAPLEQDIRSKKFLSIEVYTYNNPVPEPVGEAVKDNYQIAVTAYGREWWVPRPISGKN